MPIRSWLQRVMGNGGDAEPGTSTPPAIPETPISLPNRAAAIAHAVELTGLVRDNPEAMAFYRSIFADHPRTFVTYEDLRKQGELLDKEALKALGLRANVKLSAEFFATLNDMGRTDPIEAAGVIGLAISTALCTRKALSTMASAGVDEVKLHASNMAAGPCTAATALQEQPMPLTDAPLLPLASCTHPGQCGCLYQAKVSFLER